MGTVYNISARGIGYKFFDMAVRSGAVVEMDLVEVGEEYYLYRNDRLAVIDRETATVVGRGRGICSVLGTSREWAVESEPVEIARVTWRASK